VLRHREVQRLVAQCWNRGCHHANFSRGALAARFLALALRLLDGCPELQHRKARASGGRILVLAGGAQ